MSEQVPPIIHLTARNPDNLPEQFRMNLETMRRFYPEHDIRINDDVAIDRFVADYDPGYYRRVFVRLRQQIMRVDAVRYLWMEAYGGIYFDFDIALQRRWDPIGGAVLVRREWTYPQANDITVSVHNCVFASSAGHPLWRHLLNGIARQADGDRSILSFIYRAIARQPRLSVFDVTGPNAISRTISLGQLHQRLENVQLLDASCIYQKGRSTGSLDNAIFEHQTAGSWQD